MFQAFSRSWQLIKASYRVLRSDPELLVLPAVSMVAVVILSIAFFWPAYSTGLLDGLIDEDTRTAGSAAVGIALLFLFYLVMYTIVIYSNVALVGAAMMRLRGEDPSVRDGLRIANTHLGQIVGYAALSATVGVILSMLRDRDNIIGRIIAGLVDIAWSVVTFLVVPVLVIENIGPIEAIKRSTGLLRRTWGEQIVANAGVGLVMGLITFALILFIGGPLLLIGITSNTVALVVVAIAVIVLMATLMGVLGSALNGVFQAALYNYATTGNAGPGFDEGLVVSAFKPKGR
jgi:hypothetical protein